MLTSDLWFRRDVFRLSDCAGEPASSSGDALGLVRGSWSLSGLVRNIKAVFWFRRWRWRAGFTVLGNHRWSFSLGLSCFLSLLTQGCNSLIILSLGPEWRDVDGLFTVKVKCVIKSQWSVEFIALCWRCRFGPCGWSVPTLWPGSGFGILPWFL